MCGRVGPRLTEIERLMINIREAKEDDAASFIALRSRLFRETNNMLFTPEEYQPKVESQIRYLGALGSAVHG